MHSWYVRSTSVAAVVVKCWMEVDRNILGYTPFCNKFQHCRRWRPIYGARDSERWIAKENECKYKLEEEIGNVDAKAISGGCMCDAVGGWLMVGVAKRKCR